MFEPLSTVEDLAQLQYIGLPSDRYDRSYELCEFLEAATENGLYHDVLDQFEQGVEFAGVNVIDDLQPVHYIHAGVYTRELTIPKGLFIVGITHRFPHTVIVSKGKILVWSEGEGSKMIEAPYTFTCNSGVRRIGYTLEDTVWSTIHATNLTTVPELEESLFILRPHQMYPYMRSR